MARSALRTLRRLLTFSGWLAMFAGIAALLVPSLLGFDRYVIVSGSMHPLLDRGSVVFSKPEAVDQLKVGDIITYQPPASTGVNHLVTHRLSYAKVAADGTRTFRTKGDANPGNDPWTFNLINQKQNVYRFSVPLVGYALLALANPHMRMLVIGIPAAVIALASLAELVRNWNRDPQPAELA